MDNSPRTLSAEAHQGKGNKLHKKQGGDGTEELQEMMRRAEQTRINKCNAAKEKLDKKRQRKE